MLRTDGIQKLLIVFLIALVGVLTAVAPAAATKSDPHSGEPTDPEGAFAILDDAGIDLSGHGISDAPEDGDVDSWLQDLIDLLRSLGLLPQEDPGQ